MAWYDEDSWLTLAFAPNLLTIIITTLVAILLPIFVHVFLYKQAAPSTLPSFVLLGPSGSGKTALLTLFEQRKPSQTHTSLTPQTIETSLPTSSVPSSSRYRSENDVESRKPKHVLITDTPGHGKLRHFAQKSLEQAKNKSITGIIFVVDAADLSSESGNAGPSGLREAATYLHDVLLELQQQYAQAKSRKNREVPLLVAANKMDLFTALPPKMVKAALEAEITRLRTTRARGIASIGKAGKGEGLESGAGEEMNDEDGDVLGGDVSGKFEFAVMRDWGVDVSVIGGSVSSDAEGPGVDKWWDWIAELL